MTKLSDQEVFGTPKTTRFTDEEVFGPRSDTLDTARLGAAGLTQGLNEGLNPLKVLAGLAHLGTVLNKTLMPTAPVELAAPAIKSIDEASKYTQPADFLKNFPVVGDLLKMAPEAPRTVAEAYERTGAEKTPLREFVTGASKAVGGAVASSPLAALGPLSYLIRSGTGAVGAGAGQVIAGDEGAAVGNIIGTGTPVPRRAPPPAPTTQSYLRQGGAALDDFAATPAAVTPQSFNRYAQAVEGQINPYSRTSNLYGQYPLPPSSYPNAAPLMERLRTWATGRTQDGRPIHGFTMEELKAFRDEVNTGLKSAAPRSQDQRVLLTMKDQLDEYLTGLRNNTDALHGNVEAASAAVREGIGLYSQGMAARAADEMARSADLRSSSYVLSNADRATRVEFGRAIRNRHTLARLEGAAPGVTQALEEAGTGGQLRNIEAFIGRYSPHGVIPAMGHVGAALSGSKGATAAVASGIVTTLFRFLANARARADAANVSDFIRRGGPAPVSNAANPAFIGAVLDAIRDNAFTNAGPTTQ